MGTAVVIAAIVGLTVATAGAGTVGVAAAGAAGAAGGSAAAAGAALTTPLMLATYGTGAVVVTIADANMGEGLDSMEKSTSGNLDRGFNYIRDTVFGGDEKAYQIFSNAADIVFGIVSGKAMGSISGAAQIGKFACGSRELRNLKAAIQITGNVLHMATDQLISTGKLDPLGLAAGAGMGYLQGYLGSSITNSILAGLGMQDMKLLEALIGTGVDTGLEGLLSALSGMPFDFWDSLERNGFANFLAAYISDPVDAATGAYIIRETDSILASLPSAFKLERIYRSTQKTDSVFGRGWSFPYASRIFRDTQDTENPRIHMNTVTGHSLCYEKQDGVWVSQCKGTSRFVLEVREEAGHPETEVFLLTDIMEHTVYVYDREGRLSYVEYPNRLKLVLSYGSGGLERITTPLGNVLEIESREGRILQITDEIGRCTRYRYAGDFLTDVVYADEGITP